MYESYDFLSIPSSLVDRLTLIKTTQLWIKPFKWSETESIKVRQCREFQQWVIDSGVSSSLFRQQ